MESRIEGGLPLAHLTEPIIGVFYDVFRELGAGFSEMIYCRAFAIALRQAHLEVDCEPLVTVNFRGLCIGTFKPDIVVERSVLLEVKATTSVEPYAEAQLLNYLKAAGGGVGLLFNFGRRAEFKRRVLGDPLNSLPLLRNPTRTKR